MKHNRVRAGILLILFCLFMATSFATAIESKFTPVPKEIVAFLRTYEGDLVDELLGDGSASLIGQTIDLNSDGVNEYFVQARGSLCGAANCPTWVLRRDVDVYRVILDARSIQEIHMLATQTNGYADIQTRQHGSATESTERIFKFAGAGYNPARCTEISYTYKDRDGKWREHERPKRVPCR